jgi:hypothetical protein
MKCLKCGANTPYSATSSLCPACTKPSIGNRTKKKFAVALFGIMGICLVLIIALSLLPDDGTKVPAKSIPSRVKWSGAGPDCTPDGHPDPKHPGIIISDLYSNACPSEPSSPADPLEDADALDAKYGTDATVYCGDHTDDYLQSIAKYNFKWNVGVLAIKFDSYLRHVNKPGILTLVSNKASLQNGFGAYKRVTLQCDYDTQHKKVMEYRLQP